MYVRRLGHVLFTASSRPAAERDHAILCFRNVLGMLQQYQKRGWQSPQNDMVGVSQQSWIPKLMVVNPICSIYRPSF